MAQAPSVLETLRRASDGLLFISETEAELTPFSWPIAGPLDEKAIRANPDASYEPETPLETMTLESLLRAVPPEDRAKFEALTRILDATLKDIRVYKLGDIEKDVYIAGKTSDGSWAGLRTQVVET